MAVFRAFFHGAMSGYEVTCLKSFLDHGHDVVVYSYRESDVDPMFEREDADTIVPRRRFFLDRHAGASGTPATFSDIFRYTLLEKFDDWWIDTDVLCLSNEWPVAEGRLVAGWERDDSINCAVLRLGPAAAAALKKAASEIGRATVWGELGPALVTRYVHDAATDPLILPKNKFYAVPLPQWDWLYSERLCAKVEEITRDALAVHLWNEHGRRNLHDKRVPPPPLSFFGRAVERHGTARYFRNRASAANEPHEQLKPYVLGDHGGAPIRTQSLSAPAYGLPLVSFVVVNYNYGRFLRQCVESIMHQEYSDIECIVVDNASTDDSIAILDELAQTYASLRVLKNARNDGQSAACRDGFKLAGGAYVAFVDADDYYLPTFAATHVRVHLTTPVGMGFTSGDMLQTVNDQVVGGTCFEPRSHIDASLAQDIFRDTAHLGDAPKLHGLHAPRYAAQIKIIPRDNVRWVWSPTSGNLYRSDAIRLLLDNPQLESLRFATDAYLNFAVNALTGSVLIDKPLAVYRIHDSNNFTRHPGLSGIVGFAKESNEGTMAAALALEHIALNIRAFSSQAMDAISLTKAMRVLLLVSQSQKWFLLERLLLAATARYFRFLASRNRRMAAARLRKQRSPIQRR